MKLVANAAMRRAAEARARAEALAIAPPPVADAVAVAQEQRAPDPPQPIAAAASVPAHSEKQRQRYEANKRVQAVLEERWPRVFGWAKPLAIGIREQISAELAGQVSDDDLHAYLRMWVNREPYRAALARGYRRVNLDGSDAGPAMRDDAGMTEAA